MKNFKSLSEQELDSITGGGKKFGLAVAVDWAIVQGKEAWKTYKKDYRRWK
ncbi:bacteriocin class II family protein [Lactobacillus sp. CBA3605]|uniref:bacteriocin class II family protein n=1 Tax=Lactobacillus sp. CBA3605 TaxID=2099788 RepID=UPI001319E0B1|nr:bacteriocin class II family protein [Lactobacillus sp. CBA3605]